MNITITASVLIAAASLTFTIFREWKHSNAKDTAQETTILIKLENIGSTVGEIKAEMSDLRKEWREHNERLVKIETQMETVWKRIDDLKRVTGMSER